MTAPEFLGVSKHASLYSLRFRSLGGATTVGNRAGQIALLEKVVTEGAAGQAAAGESEEGELGSRSKAPVPEPEEAGKASSSPPGTGDEESQARELLEDRLRIWEAEVKESKQTAAEMEGVIAGLRKGEVRGCVSLRCCVGLWSMFSLASQQEFRIGGGEQQAEFVQSLREREREVV